ncbi:hypothetical protein [Carnobacterium funditum]|uniref:hypothetical protein n=1 Tax=Carnobacterium funditum TaxID=2752 RepID=UPI00054D68F2|nr:hypothetical protein [Carnobacterium funditum]
METCEVFFSNGYSLNVDLSQSAFIEVMSTEDGLLDNRLILLETIEGESIYVNPLQIVSVRTSFSEMAENNRNVWKESENKKKESHNLEAVKSLSENIKNME